MRQIVQHLGSGRTELIDVPAPAPRRGRLLVRASRSLVSLGTERMLVEFGRAGWLSKARQQPEKFRAVLGKVRSEGLFPTLVAVRGKLAQPIPLGYCHV
ncbi:MAG: dehydrogenase, partial [Verrucomicrobiota bacterium]